MDCLSEEHLIRIKLDGMDNIKSLDFDIPKRLLTVYHQGRYEPIFQKINQLKLDASLVDSLAVDSVRAADDPPRERKLLWQVLAINFFLFVLEISMGFVSDSIGLVADSLDMFADSIVYGLALFAAGGTITGKKNIAKAAGYLQLILAVLGFAEVVRRFTGLESVPAFRTMIITSVLALIGNIISFYLLQKARSKEAHMQASMIFTSNDIIVNLGVIAAGFLVYLTHSNYPDLIIGTIVFAIVGRGALKILKLADKNREA